LLPQMLLSVEALLPHIECPEASDFRVPPFPFAPLV
jgi:hypothetical protein